MQFESVLHEHWGMLTRLASIYELRPAQRNDLLQDIAFALWRALPNWRGESSLKTFIARIAHNRGVDHVLHQRRHGHWAALPDDIPDTAANPEREILQEELQSRLIAAIRKLPLGHQQVLTLALEGFLIPRSRRRWGSASTTWMCV